jgi:hypothetical protein
VLLVLVRDAGGSLVNSGRFFVQTLRASVKGLALPVELGSSAFALRAPALLLRELALVVAPSRHDRSVRRPACGLEGHRAG